MSRKRKTDLYTEDSKSEDEINIEEWKRDFFSNENGWPQKDNNALLNENPNNDTYKDESELFDMMNPDAFDRVPMIYEQKSPEFIEKNWKETRSYLTKDYIKKSKLASRKLKNRTFN